MCDACDWEELVERIDELIDSDDADFALDTLESMRDWITDNEHCTDRQREAVANIARAAGHD